MGQSKSKSTKKIKSEKNVVLDRRALHHLIKNSSIYNYDLFKEETRFNYNISYNIPFEVMGFLYKKCNIELLERSRLVYYTKNMQKNRMFPIPEGYYEKDLDVFGLGLQGPLGLSDDEIQDLGMKKIMQIESNNVERTLSLMIKLIPHSRLFMSFIKETDPKIRSSVQMIDKFNKKRLLNIEFRFGFNRSQTFTHKYSNGIDIFSIE